MRYLLEWVPSHCAVENGWLEGRPGTEALPRSVTAMLFSSRKQPIEIDRVERDAVSAWITRIGWDR
jgi:hypothetical protein